MSPDVDREWCSAMEQAEDDAALESAIAEERPGVPVPDDAIAEVSHTRTERIVEELRASIARHCPSAPAPEVEAAARNLAAAWGFYGIG